MDVDLKEALELAEERQRIRIKNRKEKSRDSRSYYKECDSNFVSSYSFHLAESYETNTISDDASMPDNETMNNEDDIIYLHLNDTLKSTNKSNQINFSPTSIFNCSHHSDETSEEEEDPSQSIEYLHPYTDVSTNAFCYRSLQICRELRISKSKYDLVSYKKIIRENNDIRGTKDIPYGEAYQDLLRQYSSETFISALLHLDGVTLFESSKLKMWLFSFAIIELPANLRYRRFNMPIISIWISYSEPNTSLWLRSISVNNEILKLKILAVTGDCPALKYILNIVAHNGYYSCFFCYIKGIHRNKKRQYPYQQSRHMRTAHRFAQDSLIASRSKCNEKGHLGVSVITNIVDIPLPRSIIIDYAHASLLRHSKAMFVNLYNLLRPAAREAVDDTLVSQPFPHFFHRKMRSFQDLSFIKATEVRNILFYGILPIFHRLLPLDILSHFALFICGLRLLHGRPIFGDETATIADSLITRYYKDFDKYHHGLENLVLHLHIHYVDQYKLFGAFSHLGSFGQGSLIGYVSSNQQGSRFVGDSICRNYSTDFILHNKIDSASASSTTQIIDGPFDQSLKGDLSNYGILSIHNSVCYCSTANDSPKLFCRCVIQERIYHSIHYTRHRKSVSFFIRYRDADNPIEYRFGKIIIFFTGSITSYALVERYPVDREFIDLLLSPYYKLLYKSVNQLFFVISKTPYPNLEPMNDRIRTQKKIFTPTTTATQPQSFLCRSIETGECVIVHRSSLKRTYDDTAEIIMHGRRTEVKIEFRVSNEESNAEDEQDTNSEEDPIEILTTSSVPQKLTKHGGSQHQRSLIDDGTHTHDRHMTSYTNKKIKKNNFQKNTDLGENSLNDDNNDNQDLNTSSDNPLCKHMEILFGNMKKENDKKFNALSKKIDRKFNADITDLSAFRDNSEKQLPNAVIHNGENLLNIRGKSIGDYARQVLRTLYSHEELISSILPPGGPQYSRKCLDQVKFEKLHEAMRCKYRIAEEHYDNFYGKLIRPKLVDFLGDERKRDRKQKQ
ncbi:unnamed protein product [Rotaria sordida]|uniref:Uncharacterized protein n=1 Tax=Rotaria sordida TaxID=392033 RepID=A0A819BIN7_9BILA|nr:unnamed protein product [Rotaria sordida]CAF1445612.1 unnamed protein product [Rotaria sordida]CAF3802738.1 unnamed protein product [Rotaria sordida]CAF3893538.1 unnamed protein product [Rotaria sordida]